MVTKIVFMDGSEVLLGYDGCYSIIVNNEGLPNQNFHIYYVGGEILTVAQYDRYVTSA